MAQKRLRVVLVTSQDSGGGAPRAIHRIFKALREYNSHEGDFFLRVVHKSHSDSHILGGRPQRSKSEYLEYFLRTRFRKYFPRRPFVSPNKLLHSTALYPSGLGRELNAMKPDVVLLGWLGNSTLSIREIGRLQAPVVWRLSDMWMFSGAEHYTSGTRHVDGYSRASRKTAGEEGPDINRETFLRKKRSWKVPRDVICPSTWISEEVRRSALTQGWRPQVIPNVIDPEDWKPLPKETARRNLEIPKDAQVVLYGAGAGLKDHHKGGDLFLDLLRKLKFELPRVNGEGLLGAVFGQECFAGLGGNLPLRLLGRLDDQGLKTAYSAADVMVVPSRLDNLPSTALEAQTMGLPVVGFRIGGLPDIVEDGKTGFLAEPFDTRHLAQLVHQLLRDTRLREAMGAEAQGRARKLWSPKRVAAQYFEVLRGAAQLSAPES